MRSLALFNNKGGVGKTTLTFNIAHMLARLGKRTVVLDYDPQCNISALFLDDEQLAEIWDQEEASQSSAVVPAKTVAGAVDLVRRGKGGVREPELVEVAEDLWFLPNHLSLSRFEQQLAEEWPKKTARDNERALDVTTALDLLSNLAAERVSADVVMIDMGSSLGALNRAALLSCDAVVIPLAPDLFSLQGLENVGPTLREWRADWMATCGGYLCGRPQETLPIHAFRPIGYIVQQYLARTDRLQRGHEQWADQIPYAFRAFVLDDPAPHAPPTVENDEHCIALIKHFASLVPLAQLARKPLFDLKQADGIGGGQVRAVAQSKAVFKGLAEHLLDRLHELPEAKATTQSQRSDKVAPC